MQEEHSVDFLKKKYKLAPEQKDAKRPKLIARLLGVFIVAAAIGGIIFSYNIAETYLDKSENGNFSFFGAFKQLVTSDDKVLTGEKDDRVNFLLMGVGGAGHDGPELSDTIMFASFRPSSGEVGMMSIPRDTIVPIPGYGYRKINHVNAYGEIEEEGQGPVWAADIVGELLDQDIHYTVKVDFAGFEELIDAIGGVDIYVETTFTDYTYPTDDYLVQTVSFQEGWQYMDGETALQYSRSRHGTNGEGSDFARAKRQQNLLLAVKSTVLTPTVFLNPGKINKVIQTFQDNVETNMSFWEIMKLAKYAPDIDTENITHHVLDASYDSPLYESVINGSYVLLPRDDDWSEIQSIAENVFDGETAQEATEMIATEEALPAAIEIQNGTNVTGLAFETSQLLSGSGFNVLKIGNAQSREYPKTIIYDLTKGEKSDELSLLTEFLEADVQESGTGWALSNEVEPRELTVTPSGEEQVTTPEPIDFLIILGDNAQELVLR
jgi:polyisoprenyl-teichoic acid--peptidoglycan teichoic acid transferase